MSAATCGRCKGPTPTNDNIEQFTFWGAIQTKVTTTTTRSARLRATYYRRNPRHGSPMIRADEEQAICDGCWSLLIGRFLQGRSVPALPGKENL